MDVADIAMRASSKDFALHELHHFGGGVYAKQIHIPAGSFIVQHKHAFDHLSVLASGKVYVGVGDEVVEYTAPACVLIKAGANHVIEATADAVWFCIHATECVDAESADKQLIEGVSTCRG
jgi:quercetin dioxygenase-like cupin family protein